MSSSTIKFDSARLLDLCAKFFIEQRQIKAKARLPGMSIMRSLRNQQATAVPKSTVCPDQLLGDSKGFSHWKHHHPHNVRSWTHRDPSSNQRSGCRVYAFQHPILTYSPYQPTTNDRSAKYQSLQPQRNSDASRSAVLEHLVAWIASGNH